MKNLKEKAWFLPVITTIFLALFCYGAYSLWYIFYGYESDFETYLYTALCGISLGVFATVFVDSVFKKSGKVPKIIAFICGNALFHGVIWGVNAKINFNSVDNERVNIITFTVCFSVAAILLLAAFIARAKNKYRALNGILAVVYFAVSCGGLYLFNEENIKSLKYNREINFESISAENMVVRQSEMKACRDWFDTHLVLRNGVNELPFDFAVDGVSLNDTIKEWDYETSKESEEGAVYEGGKTTYLTLTHPDKDIEVKVEATIYEEKATCDWTVYLKNTAKKNSGVINDFYALDDSFSTGDATLYYSNGSNTSASDFALMKKNISFVESKFAGNEGRPTNDYMPYFNINGENSGFVLGIGWTGQWAASIKKDGGATHITVKQESFNAYLLPGEEVRSPLVSLSFYDETNPLKGFNIFRDWVTDCLYPKTIKDDTITMLEVAGPTSTRTSDEIIEILDGIRDEIYDEVNCFWMDAGWYNYSEGWYDGVGNWTPDTSRYDNGIKELSDYAKSVGCGHVLWYEPERVYEGTQFYEKGSQEDQWLVKGDGMAMWNLADEGAFKYLCKYMAKSLKENGVTVYRQDFNYAPLEYWQKADAEFYDGRTGICENHYVTNLYKYLDYLCKNVKGLYIDNCASGGKRLDLEMTKRSIPIWRSDYNCAVHSDILEATQAQTYGLSFWLPMSGTCLYVQSEYAVRSGIMPCTLIGFGGYDSEFFNLYDEQRQLMVENYYPLQWGGYNDSKILAMQYSTADGLEGEALIYKRPGVNDKEYTLKLNGLDRTSQYEIYDIDNPEKIYSMSGEELMSDGLLLQLPEGEKAIIMMFKAK